MCKLCNGRRVIHEESPVAVMFVPCPNCTRISKEEAELRSRQLKARLDQAFAEMGMEDVS
ncbi:hypothetical protein [Metabacillus fastidiosus]|uniref:hypothetical protein n=1 Tax=Metabacillus fastidiosus TaxID=1458 RepID=UPI0008269581|nr:hypothetical protein [Metabacillus fastidiosus]MED4461830.1 hypothetical protein [Metabacillus fastidiosus]